MGRSKQHGQSDHCLPDRRVTRMARGVQSASESEDDRPHRVLPLGIVPWLCPVEHAGTPERVSTGTRSTRPGLLV